MLPAGNPAGSFLYAKHLKKQELPQVFYQLFDLRAGAKDDVMVAAFHDGRGRDERQTGILLQVGNGLDTAVAHGALDLVETDLYIVMQGACVGHERKAPEPSRQK